MAVSGGRIVAYASESVTDAARDIAVWFPEGVLEPVSDADIPCFDAWIYEQ
jgi:hypothetical protein